MAAGRPAAGTPSPVPRAREFMEQYARPFATLVVADLLGVPAEDHPQFRAVLSGEPLGGLGEEETVAHNPLLWLEEKFAGYITDRRADPARRYVDRTGAGEIS